MYGSPVRSHGRCRSDDASEFQVRESTAWYSRTDSCIRVSDAIKSYCGLKRALTRKPDNSRAWDPGIRYYWYGTWGEVPAHLSENFECGTRFWTPGMALVCKSADFRPLQGSILKVADAT